MVTVSVFGLRGGMSGCKRVAECGNAGLEVLNFGHTRRGLAGGDVPAGSPGPLHRRVSAGYTDRRSSGELFTHAIRFRQ